MTFDRQGTIYLNDAAGVRTIDRTGQVFTLIPGGGSGTAIEGAVPDVGRCGDPYQSELDSDGTSLFMICTQCVMRLNLASATLTTYSGTPGTAWDALPADWARDSPRESPHVRRRTQLSLRPVLRPELKHEHAEHVRRNVLGDQWLRQRPRHGSPVLLPHFGLAVSQGAHVVYITDFNNRVRQIDQTGLVSDLSGSGAAGIKAGWPDEAMFYTPRGPH
jgi:hypothetical protein